MLSGIERVRVCRVWALVALALKCFAMTSGIVTQWPWLVDVDQLDVKS